MNSNNRTSFSQEIERHRILDSMQASAFWGVSRSHWRRLYQSRRVPTPIKIGERKLGWRVGDLIDGLNERRSKKFASTSERIESPAGSAAA
jgi:predicted DNA-binding transcriptional regulator AlpA